MYRLEVRPLTAYLPPCFSFGSGSTAKARDGSVSTFFTRLVTINPGSYSAQLSATALTRLLAVDESIVHRAEAPDTLYNKSYFHQSVCLNCVDSSFFGISEVVLLFRVSIFIASSR